MFHVLSVEERFLSVWSSGVHSTEMAGKDVLVIGNTR